MSDTPIPVGRAHRLLRVACGVAAIVIQDNLGISIQRLTAFERGDRDIKIRTMLELAKFWGVSGLTFLELSDPGKDRGLSLKERTVVAAIRQINEAELLVKHAVAKHVEQHAINRRRHGGDLI